MLAFLPTYSSFFINHFHQLEMLNFTTIRKELGVVAETAAERAFFMA